MDDASWLDRRANFLASAHDQSRERICGNLARAEADLYAAASCYGHVVLWFEHDSYDQLNLARCLAQFAETTPGGLRW